MFTQAEKIEQALDRSELKESDKTQIRLALQAKKFAEEKLGLKKTGNYSKYVELDRASVSYVVSASPKWELKPYLWSFPFTGDVPYKGFFNEPDAKSEAAELREKDLDTYVRGVSAYSLLGWFNDPLYSSMLRSKPHDLVNTIIHETVHATVFFKGLADFNERLATFIGDQATEQFYFDLEGPESKTVEVIRNENHDQKIFSKFISQEIQNLKDWYLSKPEKVEEKRRARIKEIQLKFDKDIKPLLKTDIYEKFSSVDLNNARLMVYRTYVMDLGVFQTVFDKTGKSFPRFIELAKSLEKAKDPLEELVRLSQATGPI